MGAVRHVRRTTTREDLARDTGIILAGAILALLAAQALGGVTPSAATASATPPDDTAVAVGSIPSLPTLPGLETIGPIVNPSVQIEATPTPVPFITMGPSPSESPSPSPSPTKKPSPKPSKTPTPIPVAVLSCSVTDVLTVRCDGTGSINAAAWDWDWGDSSAHGSGSIAQHVYATGGQYTIKLTVTGPGGGTNSDTQLVDVPASSP